MINDFLNNLYNKQKCTLLGVGPMSLNCVNAAIELSNDNKIPIMLIASRRQVDSEVFGGGYVNNWDTKSFSQYVKERDKKNMIILARDHGGPWQSNYEVKKNMNLKEAMESSKHSFYEDIQSDFQIVHLDPSIDIHNKPSREDVILRLFELYEYCISVAEKLNKKIIFEVGTEEQSGSTNTPDILEEDLKKIKEFCSQNNYIQPSFVVIQSGTRVAETNNIGSFDSPVRVADELPPEIQIPKMIEICKSNNIMMKAHNTDYLSDEALKWHPRLGIHAANVAPEFGVVETKSFLKILDENGLNNISEKFLELSYNSMKWKKWMIPNSKSSDLKKSIIAGHYNFSKEEFLLIKKDANFALLSKGIDLDRFLTNEIKKSILRYLKNFRMIV